MTQCRSCWWLSSWDDDDDYDEDACFRNTCMKLLYYPFSYESVIESLPHFFFSQFCTIDSCTTSPGWIRILCRNRKRQAMIHSNITTSLLFPKMTGSGSVSPPETISIQDTLHSTLCFSLFLLFLTISVVSVHHDFELKLKRNSFFFSAFISSVHRFLLLSLTSLILSLWLAIPFWFLFGSFHHHSLFITFLFTSSRCSIPPPFRAAHRRVVWSWCYFFHNSYATRRSCPDVHHSGWPEARIRYTHAVQLLLCIIFVYYWSYRSNNDQEKDDERKNKNENWLEKKWMNEEWKNEVLLTPADASSSTSCCLLLYVLCCVI